MSAGKLASNVTWWVIAVLSVGVGGYALFHVFSGFQFVPPEVKANAFFTPLGLEVHIAASAFAMLLGPFQFLKGLRARATAVHRWMGRVYVAACLVGGVSGLSIALYSSAGLVAGWGFFFLAVFWLITTAMAWTSAVRRDFVAHERWMIRSFALTFAAVTLRLDLLFILLPGMTFDTVYPVAAWACWIPNLMVAESWMAIRNKLGRRRVAPAAASA